MWNYSFVLPDFIILFVFLVYYFIHPRLPIKLNKSFLVLLLVNLAVLCIDVAASYALDFNENFSVFSLKFLNVLFFILFFARIFAFFKITEIVSGQDREKNLVYKIASSAVFVICEVIALSNLFVDLIFSISPQGQYSSKALYMLLYICAFYYIVFSLFLVFKGRKELSLPLTVAVSVYNLILAFGYLIRWLFPSYIIMNFFSLIAIIIIFITYENPIRLLAGKVNAFNKAALYKILNEEAADKNPLILGFVIHNYNELREIYSGTQMDKGLSLICLYLAKAFPDCLRFYCHDGRFVLIGDDNSRSDSMCSQISKRFSQTWSAGSDVDLFFEVKFVQVDSSICCENTNSVAKAIFSAFKEAEKLDRINILVNSDTLQGLEKNTQIKRAVEFAVENNGVEMFLQPLMDTKNYRLVGAEALARIRDEEGNLIPPVYFIPVAEKNGRINAMGEQMFEKACQFIHDHDIESMGFSWINVNLSPIQFLRPDLNNRFSRILNKYQVDASRIHLEITEESMIDYALLQKQIQTMRATGFQFVLDDYGSGYSNVSRLKRCPFINIKLDMEIVRDYFKDRDKILPTLVETFKQMGFTVTAEGVETLEMVELMKEIGCDYLQGYYFSKPLPSEEFAKTYGIK